MRESDTFLAILDEGREDEAKRMILLMGQERFGPPPEAVRAAVSTISELERLEHILVRLLHASSWEDLLQQP